MTSILPADPATRKATPLCTGLLDYFSSALVEVAKHSYRSNEQHNPGEPLHWARGKSNDHLDALMRHLVERDLVGVAWRALAALQIECESKGAPLARNARAPESVAIVLPDGVTATLLQPSMAARMSRDGVRLPDDDESGTPAELPREHA